MHIHNPPDTKEKHCFFLAFSQPHLKEHCVDIARKNLIDGFFTLEQPKLSNMSAFSGLNK